MFEGLTYLQQRQDALDREAQEMALRNAMQRLNQEEFTYKKERDAVQDTQFNRRQTLDEKQFAANEEERKYKRGRDTVEDVTGLLPTFIQHGYSGEQFYPLTSALKRGDVASITDAVKNLTASPMLQEKAKQQWARLEKALQGEDLRFFRMTRDTLYNSGGVTWDQANEEALIQLHSMRALGRLSQQGIGGGSPAVPQAQPTEGAQAGSVAVPGGGQPMGLDQFLQLGGGAASAGRDLGVNARVKAQNDSRAAFTARANQQTEFNEAMNPLRLANAQLQKEGRQLDNAMKRAKAKEFAATEPYRRKMEEIKLKHAVTLEEIAVQNKQQQAREAQWAKSMGAGSLSEVRIREGAAEEARTIDDKRKQLRLELQGVDDIVFAAQSTLKKPLPVETLPNGQPNADYGTEMQERQIARHILDTAPSKKQIINEALNSLNTMRARINKYLNMGVEKTTPAGKPTPKPTPPPQRFSDPTGRAPGSRPNTYLQGKPKLQVGKPADQRTRPEPKAKTAGKTDYSKMSTEELMQRLLKAR